MPRYELPCTACGKTRQFVDPKVAVGAMCAECGKGRYITRPSPDAKTTPTGERPTLTAEELVVSEQMLREVFG